jgi:Extensin-like protein C-terminus
VFTVSYPQRRVTADMKRRAIMLGGICIGLALVAASCSGGFRGEQRAAWRAEAEKACLRSGVLSEMPYVKQAREIEGPGSCGADYPIKVAAFATEVTASIGNERSFAAKVKPEATLSCPMVPALNRWMNEVVQPAAMEWFGQPVAELRSMGTYSCRTRNSRRGAKLSEHAFANAIDVGGFALSDGRVITIKGGWKGDIQSQGFLKTVHRGACGIFRTVLGPGSDMFHYDHLHLDLARHGRSNSAYCRPRVSIPAKPAFFDPSSTQAEAFDAQPDAGSYEKPSPGPQPMQDQSYEQEPDFNAGDAVGDFDSGQQ